MGGASSPLDLANNFSYLSKGSVVEVSTDEQGFKGVWFVATVLEPPSSYPNPPRSSSSSSSSSSIPNRKTLNLLNKKHLVYVQYHTLLSEDASNLLKENVHFSFIRPLPPPPDADPVPNFDLGDVVDAYYRDGWWTGVVTAFIDESEELVVVTFQNPPDVIAFEISELRLHRKWLEGNWVRPEKQRTAGLMFSAGKKVEVSFEKEDYRDAWFPATVLEEVDNGSFLVEYQSRGVDDDEAVLHHVNVDNPHIRPSPPHLRDKSFDLLEKVDAFYDFGWWSGVITKELADGRYIVFFKHTNTEKELDYSELRPHMDWKDGKWFSSFQDVLIPSDNQGHKGNVGNIGSDKAVSHGESELEIPSALNSMASKIDQTIPSIEAQSHVMTSPMNIKRTNLVNDDANSQPSKKLKETNVANALCQLSTSPSLTQTQETIVGYISPITGHVETHGSEEPMASDQLSAKNESFSHGKKVRSKRGKGGQPTPQHTAPLKKPGRPPKSPQPTNPRLKSPQDVSQGSIGESAEDIVNIPIVIALESNGVKNARAKRSHGLVSPKSSLKQISDQKEQLADSQTPSSVTDKEVNNSEGGTVSSQKRKRGRPPKALAKSPKISTSVNKQNGDAVPNLMVVEDHLKKDIGSPTSLGTESVVKDVPVMDKEHSKLIGDNTQKQKNTLSSVMKISFRKKDKLQEEKTAQASVEEPKQQSSARGKRGRRRTISVNTESSNQDSQDISKEKVDESLEKVDPSKKDDMAVDVLPNNMSDDQPLSMWFEGMHSTSIVDFSDPGSSLGIRTNQAPPGGENLRGGDIQSLPFVKSNLLWETIASMEVFRMIPQKPHFRPLDGFKESTREGLAIASMVTFARVVEKTTALKFEDPGSKIEEYLENLVELESHGFNVKVVRDRLMALLSFKSKHDELHNQSNGIKNKIGEHTVETSKVDEELEEIDEQIKELKEKRCLALSVKERKKSEITCLEKEVIGINEGISGIQSEFDKLAASAWVSGEG